MNDGQEAVNSDYPSNQVLVSTTVDETDMYRSEQVDSII